MCGDVVVVTTVKDFGGAQNAKARARAYLPEQTSRAHLGSDRSTFQTHLSVATLIRNIVGRG